MNTENIYNILAIDDAKDTLMLLEFDLVKEGYCVSTAESAEEALMLLESDSINLILLNMYMPGTSGLELLYQLKLNPKYKHIPVIMLSSSDDENQIVAALDFGADDYVTKPYISKVLLARIKTSLRLFEKTKKLESLANTDFLTNLPNKGAFEKSCSRIIAQAKREEKNVIIAMLDIDYFKKVNDTYGHEVGDKVLIEFASVLQDCFRDYDALGRVGGEEFAVCMSNITLVDAYTAFERFRKSIEDYVLLIKNEQGNEVTLSISVSIGFTNGESDHLIYEELLRKADKYLYEAKKGGRNRIICDAQDLDIPSEIENLNILSPLKENELGSRTNEEEQMNNSIVEDDNSPFPGIDYKIGVGNVLGDEELFKEILLMFYEDHAKDSQNIQKAISELEQDDSKRLVHTLKGVSSSIGAMTLFEKLKLLDFAINEGNKEDYQSLFDAVKPELEKVITGIEKQIINNN